MERCHKNDLKAERGGKNTQKILPKKQQKKRKKQKIKLLTVIGGSRARPSLPASVPWLFLLISCSEKNNEGGVYLKDLFLRGNKSPERDFTQQPKAGERGCESAIRYLYRSLLAFFCFLPSRIIFWGSSPPERGLSAFGCCQRV